VTNLIFSMLEFKPAYDATGNWPIALNSVKWALDWLVKAHVRAGPNASDNAFVGQVGVVEQQGLWTTGMVEEQPLVAPALSSSSSSSSPPKTLQPDTSTASPRPLSPGVWQERPPVLWPP
jgi:hypothetical protein